MRVTKNLFLNALSCSTKGWFLARAEQEELSPGEELRILEGIDIGTRARSIFPDGVLVDSKDPVAAAKQTSDLLKDPNITTIFEATFIADEFIAKADVLIRDGNSWRLIEVKSSLYNEDKEVSVEHIDDLAYTTFVLSKSGLPISEIQLMLISRNWRLGQDNKDLLISKTCKSEVLAKAQLFQSVSIKIAVDLLGHQKPPATISGVCGYCNFFDTTCIGKGLENSIFQIPRLHKDRITQLAKEDILEIKELPQDFKLSDIQQRVVNGVLKGDQFIDHSGLTSFLSAIKWPAYFLDFETVKSAIPLWEGIAPHEQIVTQFSIHVCEKPGQVKKHHQFLAHHDQDCRRELAEELLLKLKDQGSIVVYSSFEKTALTSLGKLFPDLMPKLQNCISRLVDLEVAFKKYYYHPKFKGRTSIKYTLPALADMSYDDLEISNGDLAISAFMKMAKGLCDEMEIKQTRDALLKYCHQDTLAMVRLHECLVEITVGE